MAVADWAWLFSVPGLALAVAVAAWVAVLVAVEVAAWVWSLGFDSPGVVADAAWVAVLLAVAAGTWLGVDSADAAWVAVLVAVAAVAWVLVDLPVAAWLAVLVAVAAAAWLVVVPTAVGGDVTCGACFEMRFLKRRSGLGHPAGMHHSQSASFDLARPRRRNAWMSGSLSLNLNPGSGMRGWSVS